MATLENLNVKNLLQSHNRSNYEMLMTEITDFIIREKKISNQIDLGQDDCDLNFFRMAPKIEFSMKHLLYPEHEKGFERYDKNNQENRQLHISFGKPINADKNGSLMKKLIYRTNKALVQDCSFQVDTPKMSNSYFHEDCDGKTPILTDHSIYEALWEAPVSTQMQEVKACMSYLNKIRLELKKRNFETSLFTLQHHLNCIDKVNRKTVDLDEFIQILRKVDINLDPQMFCLLLEKFGLISDHCVFYDEALKLLYWKCETPPLVKHQDLSKEWQYYKTTYQEASSL